MVSNFQKKCPNKRKLKGSNVHERETPTDKHEIFPLPLQLQEDAVSMVAITCTKPDETTSSCEQFFLENMCMDISVCLLWKKRAQHIIQQVKINKYMAQTMQIQARPRE